MAEAASGALTANVQLANALAQLVPSLFGKKGGTQTVTTGGSTATQQTILDPEAVNALMKQLLEGSGLQGTGKPGLSTVASAQKRAGLYNSSTGNQIINDLLSRITAEVAIAGAPKVTTTSPTSQVTKGVGSQQGMLGGTGTLLGLGALVLGSKSGRKKLEELYGDIFGKSIASDISGADAADLAAGVGMRSFPSISSGFFPELESVFGASSGFNSSALDTFADFGSAEDFSSFGAGAVGATADVFGGAAGGFDPSALDTFGDFGDVSGGFGGSVPILGPLLNLASGNVKGAAGSAAGGAIGSAIFPGVGTAIGSFLGNTISKACFITTAVCEYAGKPDDCHELQVLRDFRDTWMKLHHPDKIDQYYKEAPGIVDAIKKRTDAALIFKIFDHDYIKPAVRAIEAENPREAYYIYTRLFNLAKSFLPVRKYNYNLSNTSTSAEGVNS